LGSGEESIEHRAEGGKQKAIGKMRSGRGIEGEARERWKTSMRGSLEWTDGERGCGHGEYDQGQGPALPCSLTTLLWTHEEYLRFALRILRKNLLLNPSIIKNKGSLPFLENKVKKRRKEPCAEGLRKGRLSAQIEGEVLFH